MKMRIQAAACAAVAASAMSASAGQLVLELTTEYSSAAYPAGTGPWARATFTDKAPGVVGLVLECLLQDPGEFMAKASNTKGWDFNLDPAMDPDDLAFTYVSGKAASAILTEADDFQAGPDRWFDIVFQWTNGLRGGDTSEYDLSIAGGGLTAASFDFATSSGPAGRTGWHTAVHVQGISNPSAGQGGSGWMGGGPASPASVVPLPGAGAMGLAGMGLLASRRRRALA